MGKQVLAGLVTLLIGAMLALLLRSAGNDAMIARNAQDIRDMTIRITAIENSNAAGGPPNIESRVGRDEETLKNLGAKVDDIYSVIVLHQVPRLRGN